MPQPLISTVVLNWHSKQDIDRCIDSLLIQTYEPHEVIVVDNHSADGSLEHLKIKYKENITIVCNNKNLGFSGGVNSGIRVAQGSWIALLNSDATVDEDWLQEMLAETEKEKEIAMVACKTYLMGRDNILDNTGELLYRDGLNRPRGRLEKDKGQYDHNSEVLCPSGCAALYKKSTLEEAGLFDEDYFAYGEDLEIGLRLRMLGYTCRYAPKAIAYHKLSGSSSNFDDYKLYLVERNRLWTVIKCFSLSTLLLSPLYTLLRYGYLAIGLLKQKGPAASYAKKSNPLKLLWIVIKVHISLLYHLPGLLKKRKHLNGLKKINQVGLKELLEKHGISPKEAALNEVY